MTELELLRKLVTSQEREIAALKKENQNLKVKLMSKPKKLRNAKTSKYKGVSFDRTHNVFRAQIFIAGKVRPLGTFPPTDQGEIAASEAYRNAKANKANLEKKYKSKDRHKQVELTEREQRLLDHEYLEKTKPEVMPEAKDAFGF